VVSSSKQNGVVMDSGVVRVFLDANTFSHATVSDRIPRIYRQVSRRAQVVHQAVIGLVRGEFAN